MTDEKKIVVEHIKQENKETASIELGTAAKGGGIKVYGDPNEPEAFKKKIDNMVEMRNYANEKMYGNTE